MDTFYFWSSLGQFNQIDAYTWAEAKMQVGKSQFFCDPTDPDSPFGIIDDIGDVKFLPRWAMPKEFLLRLVLLGVGI